MKKTVLLFSFLLTAFVAFSQPVPYGNNSAAGKYLDAGDARLYYEVYGSGRPLLLLHGDTFGYIDEFDAYIPLLAKYFKVIAPGMRGHGKSGIGTKTYSYKLFAEDALAVLKNETTDSAVVMGFSAGAITAYYLAANYPQQIRRAVVLGGILDTSGYRPEALEELKHITGADCEKMLPELVKSRKALMPEPGQYDDVINRLRASWLQPVYVSRDKAAAIPCPVLVIGGDRDEYIRTEEFFCLYRLIPHAQLAIIPRCGHVGLLERPAMVTEMIIPFLINK